MGTTKSIINKASKLEELINSFLNYKDFSDLSDQDKIDAYLLDSVNQSFTSDELWSLKMYRGARYSDIRSLLSGKMNEKTDKDFLKVVEQDIDNIHRFISKNPLKSSKTFYRMIKGDAVSLFKNLKPGSIFEDKSFSSCSLEPQLHFGSFTIKILAKKDSLVAPILNKDEFEYLIQRGSKYAVLSNEENKITVQLL